VAAAAAGAAAPAEALRPAPAATSVYTDLDLDRCRRTQVAAEGESAQWRCPGYGGVPLVVLLGDGRFDIDAGADNGVWESSAVFNNPGPRVEWRVRRGARPHAIIYRLRLTGDGNEGRSVLGVETISYDVRSGGRQGWAGCLVAWIDGGVPNANAVARRIADRMDRRFRCGHTEPEELRDGR
jgi:hypothetical protein